MPPHKIVIGQGVSPIKVERAKQLRQEMTPAERLLWQRVRANQIRGLRFRRQQVIDGFIVDFYCHAASLVIELDGAIHQQQAQYDAERDRVLAARGLHVLRFTNEQVLNEIESVLARIIAACG
jgi:very-short-patch-repair endonuclease